MNNKWRQKTTLFLSSQAVSLFGSSIVQFGLVWFVTFKTSSGFWVSMLTVCAYVPQFLISFFAGVWADRYSRKKLIILADTSITIATLILALMMPYISKDTILLSFFLLVSAIRSVGAGIQTPAVSAIIPQLVPTEKLMRVNGINATIQSIVQFAAPAVAAGFLATLFVSRTYGDKYIYLTVVELIGFAGMMAGGILLGVWGGFKEKMKTLVVGLFLFGALAVGMGMIENFIVYLILMFVYGIALTMIQTATTTMLQESAEPKMQGRVFGFFSAIYSGFLPLGMVVFGPLSDAVEMKWVMIGSGIALIILGVAAWFIIKTSKVEQNVMKSNEI